MRTVGHYLGGSLLLQGVGCLAQGARGIDHIIDEDTGSIHHLADSIHHLCFIGPRPAFIDDRQIRVIQLFGKRPRSHHTAHIRRDYHHIGILMLPYIAQ